MVVKIFFPLEVFYPSQAGGPANTIYWFTKNLRKRGFEPVIAATDTGIQSGVPLNRWIDNDAGKTIYIKTRFRYLPLAQTIVSLLNFHRADVVHLSSFFYPTAFITAFAARILEKKMVWSARGELDPLVLVCHSPNRKRPILWAIKKFIGTYSAFHSTCDEETEHIRLVFGDEARIFQIPNYLEIPAPAERNESKYLLYIGRIHPKKAIENLLEALSLSKEFLDSGYVLKIAGLGKKSYENELRKMADELGLTEKVAFVGQVEGKAKEQIYADAFWTIMPSHSENFGIVVLESLAQSTPVIASTGSPWQQLEAEKTGFWVDNAPEVLAQKISEIFRMPAEEYEEYRRRCRSYVEREFDIHENIDRWVELYSKL